jgi:glutamate-ammonia-ligase adenylyltransferase
MAGGRLYEVDMRLRPSGRQGPVATSFAAFRDYQQSEAWTWEHLALTRARPLTGDAGLCARIESCRRQILASKGQGARVLRDAAAMRARLLAARPAEAAWEAKDGPGRLMDIEFLAQTAALLSGDPSRGTEEQLRAGLRSGFLSGNEVALLDATLRLCRTVQVAGRLLTEGALDPGALGEGGRAFLLREAGAADGATLTARIAAQTADAAGIIGARLGLADHGGDDGDADL